MHCREESSPFWTSWRPARIVLGILRGWCKKWIKLRPKTSKISSSSQASRPLSRSARRRTSTMYPLFYSAQNYREIKDVIIEITVKIGHRIRGDRLIPIRSNRPQRMPERCGLFLIQIFDSQKVISQHSEAVSLEKERIEGKTFHIVSKFFWGGVQHEINDKIYKKQIGSNTLKTALRLILIFSILV